MLRLALFLRLSIPAIVLVAAADPPWAIKEVSQWSEDDARQVLAGSPWVKRTTVALVPERSESQLRDGGKMGGGSGGKPWPGKGPAPDFTKQRDFMVRWESAVPVRTAELIAHESGAPDWDGDYYAIAVYGVPGFSLRDGKTLAGDLRRMASLKRDGKRDLKPARVDVLVSAGDLATVVYLFPRSIPISAEDRRVEFVAQIRRFSLAQNFFPQEMQFRGKLEL